jgi:hypothetical protein
MKAFRGIGAFLAPAGGRAPFDAHNVSEAPATSGVYFLYTGQRLVYIGVAANGATIRERLQHHLRGEDGTCREPATEFSYEPARDPLPLYWTYVNVYRGPEPA